MEETEIGRDYGIDGKLAETLTWALSMLGILAFLAAGAAGAFA